MTLIPHILEKPLQYMLLRIIPEQSVDRKCCGSSVVLIICFHVDILQRITYDCGTPLTLPVYFYSANLHKVLEKRQAEQTADTI